MAEGPKVQSKLKVLEEGDVALIEGSTEATIISEGDDDDLVSFTDLAAPDAPEVPTADKTTVAPAIPAKPAVKPAAASTSPAADELPPEYKGKSVSEIVKMHREAQQALGRQGTELGELRRTADMALRLAAKHQTPAQAAAAAAKLPEESEIFAKPIESINALIEAHPVLKKIQEALGQTAATDAARTAQASQERFQQAHPDFRTVLGDPEFRSWVNASPIRTQLMSRAHNSFDFHAGDEVFSTWKALKGGKNPQAANEPAAAVPAEDAPPTDAEIKSAAQTLARAKAVKAARDGAAAAAAMPTGGSSAAAQKGGKKVYRRADLIRLAVEDPDRYDALSPEIDAAYREGRVR